MRKSTYSAIIALASVVIAGCTSEFPALKDGEESLVTLTDADAVLTKTILIDNPGIKMESFWEPGDEIGVFGGNVSNTLFLVKGGKMVFNIPISDLPQGGVYIIKDCIKKTDGYYEVIAVSDLDFASAFEEMKVGELKLDENGEQIPFSIVNGKIRLSQEESARLL